MSPTTAAAAFTGQQQQQQQGDHHRCIPSKRKLDDYAPSLEDDDDEDSDFSDLVSVRIRRDEFLAVHSSSNGLAGNAKSPKSLSDSRVSDANPSSSSSSSASSSASSSSSFWPSSSAPSSASSSASSSSSSPLLQFFVKMIGDGRNLVIQAKCDDTVMSLHERIGMMTGIPVVEQRLIFRGKQLEWDHSLRACSIENDSGLHLVGRMRSTRHPRTCQLMNDMLSFIYRLCRGPVCHPYASKRIKELMNEFFTLTPKDHKDDIPGHLQVFMSTSAPAALVALYLSPTKGNKEVAESSIKHFMNSCRISFSKPFHSHCAPIVLEFCKLLRKIAEDDPLYLSCRGTLGYLLENAGTSRSKHGGYADCEEDANGLIVMQEIFPFVGELASRLSKDLVLSMESPTNVGPQLSDVRDFSAFVHPLLAAITEPVDLDRACSSMPCTGRGFIHPLYEEELRHLYAIFNDLVDKMDKCLASMEDSLASESTGEGESPRTGWSGYLAILRELCSISKVYKGGEFRFWAMLSLRKASVCVLIIRYTKRTEDHRWLHHHKDVTDFESRRHLAMMMFREVKEDYELHEMLIDRSQLLAESFEYIARADADSLHGGLFIEFKNEEATGPGVLREWFFLVAKAIFDPHNALFVACPNDRRRFFPNPASKVDPMHLEYFTFSGRVIALALMHKVQMGIVFDRVFFLQLAGEEISLEDIRDADPFLYSSCKKILEMDAEFIDSDALGLTFVREVEELGSKRVVELKPGGRSMVVNSTNRTEYVNLLIKDCFVTSISEQLAHFARGFGDILCNSGIQKFFFQSLELEDLDSMLYGSESDICVEDWKKHTEYNGYKENDPQILWFWTIVEGMSAEQRNVLLFFWTSVKHLPVEGFRGLDSRLHIYKSTEPHDRLPSSHTCFYRLCFPPYPSMAVMEDRLRVITQEHVCCSFGTW
ncbi:hypothetical protein Tsubulata_022600 [Turnera subulata]|uniref:HECT-type E3 ubiquitin transferase n=1 Tax=Turnera subulata TaxID=218843 RepID=A0A9Q0FBH7_9ROSI|nr:hypothetical protein Tsubulata_022600 [Turnera subulata]